MAETLVITIMGADRPGLVAKLAACVADYQGNWLESRMVRLGGQFAGVLRVESERPDELIEALRALEQEGLRSLSERESPSRQGEPESPLVTLDLLGSDRPGILKALSASLARHHVNIEELTTERRPAPMTGEMLFSGHAVVRIPSPDALRGLRSDLEQIADDFLVDLMLGETNR